MQWAKDADYCDYFYSYFYEENECFVSEDCWDECTEPEIFLDDIIEEAICWEHDGSEIIHCLS